MDDTKIQEEILRIQEKLKGLDPSDEQYETLLKRLDDLVSLERKSNMEDDKTLMAAAEQAKADAQLEQVRSHESENEKTRKHGIMMTILKGVGLLGLMFAGHCFSVSTIPDRVDESMTNLFAKNKEKDEDK